MKLGRVDRIIQEDFPKEIQKWIGKLLYPINRFMSQVASILNKNITIEDNMNGAIKTFTYTGGSEFEFINPLKNKPKGIIILDVKENVDNPAVISNAFNSYWELMPSGKLKIHPIAGLTASTIYNVTFWIIGG